jgi:hypothetical protein
MLLDVRGKSKRHKSLHPGELVTSLDTAGTTPKRTVDPVVAGSSPVALAKQK